MKHMAVPVVLLLVMMASCQTTGGDQDVSESEYVHLARQVYTVAVETMTTLGRAGLLDLEDAEKFESVRVKASALLDAAEEAVESGLEFKFSDLNETIQSLKDIVVLVSKGVS